MRFLLRFMGAVVLLGLIGTTTAFSYPLMARADGHNLCSDCPAQDHEICQRSACVLALPLEAQNAVVLTGDSTVDAFAGHAWSARDLPADLARFSGILFGAA